MKTKIVTSALFAAAIALTPAYATDKNKHKAKPAPAKHDKNCLDTEIQRLENALDNVGKAVHSQMKSQADKLAAAEANLKKAKAECADLHKRVAAAEAAAKNITTEFNAFKASNEKQRQSTMASLTKIQESSKHAAKENAELKKKNQELEAKCKAACERLKAINDALEKAHKQHSSSK